MKTKLTRVSQFCRCGSVERLLLEQLTDKQRAVVFADLNDIPLKVTAEQMGIALSTASMHRLIARRKLRVKNLSELIRLGMRAGVII